MRSNDEQLEGKTIAEKYHIEEVIGRGGMGVVYKAEDTTLKRNVALKFLPPDLTRDDEARERFILEAQAAAALSHPNICTIHEIGREKDNSFIAMEYVEGSSLREKIKQGPLSLDDVLNIGIQVAEGLAAAHQKGIIHRDIKSANIMVTRSGQAKVMDFGLAKVAGGSQITKEARTMGTIAYMSPEQTRGADVDNRSDIWSLGIVLYELATGFLPFQGDRDETIFFTIRNDEPKPVAAIIPDSPQAYDQIIANCLAKDPTQRYQNASELASDLRRLRKDTESIVSLTRDLGAKPSRPVFRRHWPIAIAVSLILAAVFVILSFLHESQPPSLLEPELPRIAVALFENKTGDPELDRLGDQITGLIELGLYDTGLVKVIEHSQIASKSDSENVIDLARQNAAVTLITGSYFMKGNDLSFYAKTLNTSSGEVEDAFESDKTALEEVFESMHSVRQRILGGLASSLDTDFQQLGYITTNTSYDAWKEYTEARNCEQRRDYEKAKEHYLKAYSLDPTFLLPRFREIFLSGGFSANSSEKYLKILLDLEKRRDRLDPASQGYLDWMLARRRGDLEGCYKTTKIAMRYMPAAQFEHAQDCLMTNRVLEALETLNLPGTRPITRGDPGWPLRVKTDAFLKLNQLKKALATAQEAYRLYPELDDNLLAEIKVLAAMGRTKDINSRWIEFKDKRNLGGYMAEIARYLEFHRYEDDSQDLAYQACAWFRDQAPPEEPEHAFDFRYFSAKALYAAGRLDEAAEIFVQLDLVAPQNPRVKVHLGLIAALKGQRTEAEKFCTALEKIEHTFAIYYCGIIFSVLGDFEKSFDLLKEAHETGYAWLRSWKIGGFGNVELKPMLDYPPFKKFVEPRE